MPHIAIFDIGKTNKKLFVFDEHYRIVFEKSEQLPETTDEDGDPCESVQLLTEWVQDTWNKVLEIPDFQIQAVNFSAYGASFVYLDKHGKILTPLYNYLKPYPERLKQAFYEKYGGEEKFSSETASPVLGSLNAGMQLFRLKYEQPAIFRETKYALHLPQYISWLISGHYVSDWTSIGCHTNLWHFAKNNYHDWVHAEGLLDKFPSNSSLPIRHQHQLAIGTGLHDSSAALIPYMASFSEPFVLLSTGTWSIALNPFNDSPLTTYELSQDCLCYLSHEGKPVKASRLFAGYEYETAMKKLGLSNRGICVFDDLKGLGAKAMEYIGFMRQLIDKQVAAIKLVVNGATVQRVFVDGGFSRNQIFMTLLAEALPALKVYSSEVAQASAVGAAMAIHASWNKAPLPSSVVQLKNYSGG